MTIEFPTYRLPASALHRWLLLALLAFWGALAPAPAHAQVVVLVNGAPVTALDIEQRAKLTQVTTGKPAARQEVIKDLIDDRLKIFIARRYGLDVSESEVNDAFGLMAKRSHLSPQQMQQSLTARGVNFSTLRDKIRSDLAWSQLVRGKFGTTLQIGDSDINNILKTRTTDEKNSVGYIYTLYPILILLPRGANEAIVEQKRREAENLRSRFLNCNDGLKLARGLREVVVRESVTRTSADFPEQLREILRGMEVGRLTAPESGAQGIEMFALCDKKQSNADAPIKNEVRQELFAKRFEAEGKKFLDEVRRAAMIEYR